MSQENVEIVRRIYDAQERGDIDAIYALYADDIQWHDHVWEGWGTVRGLDALRRRWQEWAASFGTVRFTASDLVELGDEVVASVKVSGRNRATGLDLQQSLGMLYTLRDGEVVDVHVFRSREDALEAAGPRE
jgi:ketosteroid isomerase-like protein